MTTSPIIKLLLAEDQNMVRGALAALLQLEDDMQVIDSVSDGQQALQALQQQTVDVVITDIEMPNMTGLELAQAIQADAALNDVKVIIVTTFARTGFLQRAIQAGVRGYLLKDSPSEKLADSIRRIAAGEKIYDPELTQHALLEPDPLNDRHRQVLRLAGEGKTNIEIGQQLFLSPGTVRNYLSEAMDMLDAKNRTEAARLARQKGWL